MPGHLRTAWAETVRAEDVHAEYPRPQMVRSDWRSLNGLWEFAIRPEDSPAPDRFDGEILVPFPVESTLSGVERALDERSVLWYRTRFAVPEAWSGRRVLLHFGAVDWEATVWLNGVRLGGHRGGYDAFSFDVTEALVPGTGQELVVSVRDPTDGDGQPRGKQIRQPRTIWYTAVSGIWQSVWIEPVAETSIAALRMTPDVRGEALMLRVRVSGHPDVSVVASSAHPGRPGTRVEGVAGEPLRLPVPAPRLWSPDDPFLHPLEVELRRDGRSIDRVSSYFGMRSFGLGPGPRGALFHLNGDPIFVLGPLDQGWWPDGLYTAPSDAALAYDVEVLRSLGFNALRKHVKIEPERFYHHCDRLGLLVFQDMPNGDGHIGPEDPDGERDVASAHQFELELERLIEGRGNHPSLVAWVAFNEGWGQYDTGRITERIRTLDPSRAVVSASGWADRGTGDVVDTHRYPGPAMAPPEAERASLLGEFGGLGLPLAGHLWEEQESWGYRRLETRSELDARYAALYEPLGMLIDQGLAGAIYTQTSDVEIEVNGLMTYDRRVTKLDPGRARSVHGRTYRRATAFARRREPPPGFDVETSPFGVVDGRGVHLYTLRDPSGLEVQVTELGGIVVSLRVPDRDGHVEDVVLGLDSAQAYLERSPYFGAVVGRYANRIAGGRFDLDGRTVRLARNLGPHALHGGEQGFSHRVWEARTLRTAAGVGLELNRLSPDGEEGYPGNLRTRVRYLLSGDNTLVLEAEAETDAPTVVNLSFHSYFNLRGEGRGDILDHELQIEAGRYTPVDPTLIPTGAQARVRDTPMDFRTPTRIGERIDADFQQLHHGGGYDHNWVLFSGLGSLRFAAAAHEPGSGRRLEVWTTEPGLQFYTGNHLDGSLVGKSGRPYAARSGFCLETQHFPDSPNRPEFPSTVLRPGQTYRQLTLYRFTR